MSDWLCPNNTVVLGAVIDTEMALTVTVIEACAAGSSIEVAVTVTGKSWTGAVAGAV
jgi:hypothetical protein